MPALTWERPGRRRLEGVVRVEALGDGEPVREEIWDHWDTVERLFERIARAIGGKAPLLEVAYDGARGFPTRIEMDLRADAVDDEILAEISGTRVEDG